MDLTDKKVVVVGTGVSGMGAVKLLSETSADMTAMIKQTGTKFLKRFLMIVI